MARVEDVDVNNSMVRDPGGSRVRLLDVEDGGRGSSTWTQLLLVQLNNQPKMQMINGGRRAGLGGDDPTINLI